MTDISFDVAHLAHLARLDLTATEQARLAVELAKVLTFVDQLQTIETEGVAETAQVTGLVNVLRDDELRIKNDELRIEELQKQREKFLVAVPEVEQKMVKVPVIL